MQMWSAVEHVDMTLVLSVHPSSTCTSYGTLTLTSHLSNTAIHAHMNIYNQQ